MYAVTKSIKAESFTGFCIVSSILSKPVRNVERLKNCYWVDGVAGVNK